MVVVGVAVVVVMSRWYVMGSGGCGYKMAVAVVV